MNRRSPRVGAGILSEIPRKKWSSITNSKMLDFDKIYVYNNRRMTKKTYSNLVWDRAGIPGTSYQALHRIVPWLCRTKAR